MMAVRGAITRVSAETNIDPTHNFSMIIMRIILMHVAISEAK